MDNLNLNLIKHQVKVATNEAARLRAKYLVIAYTTFGFIYYNEAGKVVCLD